MHTVAVRIHHVKAMTALLASITLCPGAAFSQPREPILVTLSVHETTFAPIQPGQEPDFATGPDDLPVALPFRQTSASPYHSTFTVVPGVKQTVRTTAHDMDVYFEITLSPPEEDTTTADVKFMYTRTPQMKSEVEGANVLQITDPFSVTKTLTLTLDGSSAEIGQRRTTSDKTSTEAVTFTSVHVYARRGQL